MGEDLSRGLAQLDLDGDGMDAATKGPKYMDQLVSFRCQSTRLNAQYAGKQRIANREQQMLVIDLEDIAEVCYASFYALF